MGFSDELRSRCAHIWDREQNHSFVTGIGDGSLPLDNFRYYMRQDYVFLIDYCRAISLAVTKARSVEDMGWFARLIHETLNTEMALHVGFCEDFGISERELLATEPSPTTWAIYQTHDEYRPPGNRGRGRGGNPAVCMGLLRNRSAALRAGSP